MGSHDAVVRLCAPEGGLNVEKTMRKHAIALAASAAALIAAAAPVAAQARYARPAFAPGVQWAQYLVPTHAEYLALQRFDLRSDPDPEARITGTLHRGETYQAAGLTEDGWVAIAENGVVVGYAPDSVLARFGRGYASR
jgi:hypothetical protein